MNDQLIKIGQSRWTSAIGSAVLGVGLGVGIGYFFSRKKVQAAEAEVEDIKQVQLELDFERAEKDREFNLQIQQAALVSRELREHGERFLESVKGLGSRSVEETAPKLMVSDNGDREEPEETPVVTNIFDQAGDEWDYAYELNERRKRSIYILHIDEFLADEMEWNNQSTLTWYEADQILCDSKDVPIYNYLEIVGDQMQFGHGSKDPNVCYIRNERLQAEYEVLRDPGSYEAEVLGGQVEERARRADVKHENSPRKFRRE